MDYFTHNRAHLNKRRIEKIDDKVMVFIIPSIVKVGEVHTELRFPYQGKVLDVYASCGTPGLKRTVIDIEKCTQSDYDTTPSWKSIFTDKLVIEANKKSSRSSNVPYTLKPAFDKVSENEHFRVNINEAGEGVKDITVELVVQIDTEG
ncbi:hypothetical protein [Bacillus haynesii]|uniref:hypothetical protein n=1 Tax=Bacillus haynesii TaxID=1925021 RepID=UPI0022818DF8|nr:hypothetical protein [Bacillus haynesii]MCY8015514.1 hypothetical protein [Bacillus haynesii]MCY8291513.1 hypothetical protein [Bacillus haynesii]